MSAEIIDPTTENLRRVAAAIREGGVVATPSDTNLALTVDPTNTSAIERVYDIKGRPVAKPLTLFVRDPSDWQMYARDGDPERVESLVDEFWPGPLNIVLEATEKVTDERLTRGGTVSVGCLSNPTWRELTAHLDGPVAMTSANKSGTVPDDRLVDVELARQHVGEAVDYIVRGEAQGTTRASTILDLTGEPELLRRGDVTIEEIACCLGIDPGDVQD